MYKNIYSKALLFALLLSFTTFSFAQNIKGDGIIKTETINFGGFKHIIAKGGFKLFLTKANKEEIKITAEQNIIELVQPIQKDSVLMLTMIAQLKKHKDISVHISYKELKTISLLLDVEATLMQVKGIEQIDIFVAERSTIVANIDAKKITLSANDNSTVQIMGKADKVKIDAHDDTILDAFGMEVNYADIVATGYSETKINCNKDLKLKVTGESSVYYTGTAKVSQRIFSSSGFIVKRKKPTVSAKTLKKTISN